VLQEEERRIEGERLHREEEGRLQEQVRQEQADFEFAFSLHVKWKAEDKIINRKKGSKDAYLLRSSSK
jgi:hypothetical protein